MIQNCISTSSIIKSISFSFPTPWIKAKSSGTPRRCRLKCSARACRSSCRNATLKSLGVPVVSAIFVNFESFCEQILC